MPIRHITLGLACLAALAATPALAQDPDANGADQVVGLFGATCLHFAGDVTNLRGFLLQQKAPLMPAAASDAFLAGRPGKVFDVSYKTIKLALISLDNGGCEAVVDQADPGQVVAVLNQSAHENNVPLQNLGSQAPAKGRAGVQQTAYALTIEGHVMHVLVSTAAAPPQAVLTLVPK